MLKLIKKFTDLFRRKKKHTKLDKVSEPAVLEPIEEIIEDPTEGSEATEAPTPEEEANEDPVIGVEKEEKEDDSDTELNEPEIIEEDTVVINTKYLVDNMAKYDSRYTSTYSDILMLVNNLIDIADKSKYTVFKDNSKDYNLNIWFSRSLEIEEDVFNDICIIFWLNTKNQWETRLFKFNTNPGIFWLKSPQNPDGTAIISPGQYRSTHSIRTHRQGTSSAHIALCHSQGIVKVFRDNNKDDILDLNGRVYTNGLGINCHRPSLYTEQTGKIHKSSAGCLIAKYRDEFDNSTQDDASLETFMGICRNSQKYWGNKFSITVIDDSNY